MEEQQCEQRSALAAAEGEWPSILAMDLERSQDPKSERHPVGILSAF
jgi:hypothetical protein